jgi:hypothetical protein
VESVLWGHKCPLPAHLLLKETISPRAENRKMVQDHGELHHAIPATTLLAQLRLKPEERNGRLCRYGSHQARSQGRRVWEG